METMLVSKSKEFAEHLLSKLPKEYAYHNLGHTKDVVKAAEEIGRNSNLSSDEMETLLVAAWLHDTGYKNCCIGHEKFSAEEAVKQLKTWGAPDQKIDSVKRAIEATRMPQNPKTILEEVLCDADLYHLSEEHLVEDSEKLRHEWQVTLNKDFTDSEWVANNLEFLKSHQYFTPYAKSILEERKKRNIKKLKKLLNGSDVGQMNYTDKEEKKKKKKDKHGKPDRGIETMFRIASENNMQLSGMADTKANIMISVNSIILSLVVTVLFRKLEEYPNLLIPTLMLVTVSLFTIIFAIKATRPNVTSGKFTKDDIRDKKTNLLFFGNFHRMELNQYDWGMREMMKDGDYLYGSLIKDIYFSGKVLARKYRALRISYSIFLYGFATSIVAFIIALLVYYNPH
jgi:predicted metal-dependent HD superfamily phosphohydrolase